MKEAQAGLAKRDPFFRKGVVETDRDGAAFVLEEGWERGTVVSYRADANDERAGEERDWYETPVLNPYGDNPGVDPNVTGWRLETIRRGPPLVHLAKLARGRSAGLRVHDAPRSDRKDERIRRFTEVFKLVLELCLAR